MWFKQIQLFQLSDNFSFSTEELMEKLAPLVFTPCLPSFPTSIGWVPPMDDDNAPLVHSANGYFMLCMQIEEKILPAAVVKKTLDEKIKKRELAEDRKIRHKEKLTLKDEVILTLLPRAFTKLVRVYGYIHPQKGWLVLGTASPSRTEQFLSLFKKSVTEKIKPFELKKLSPIITHWLKSQTYSSSFSIEKACVLQDPDQESRVIRCQQQNLFANSIQSLIKEGCEVKELALNWQDRVTFNLADDFSLRKVKYLEDILAQAKDLEGETKNQQFDADFFIMTATLDLLLSDLSNQFFEVMNSNKVQEVA